MAAARGAAARPESGDPAPAAARPKAAAWKRMRPAMGGVASFSFVSALLERGSFWVRDPFSVGDAKW